MIFVGYVGSFTLIQSSSSNWNIYTWLAIEIALMLTRLVVWANDFSIDDCPRILSTITVDGKRGPEVYPVEVVEPDSAFSMLNTSKNLSMAGHFGKIPVSDVPMWICWTSPSLYVSLPRLHGFLMRSWNRHRNIGGFVNISKGYIEIANQFCTFAYTEEGSDPDISFGKELLAEDLEELLKDDDQLGLHDIKNAMLAQSLHTFDTLILLQQRYNSIPEASLILLLNQPTAGPSNEIHC